VGVEGGSLHITAPWCEKEWVGPDHMD